LGTLIGPGAVIIADIIPDKGVSCPVRIDAMRAVIGKGVVFHHVTGKVGLKKDAHAHLIVVEIIAPARLDKGRQGLGEVGVQGNAAGTGRG